MSAKDFVSGLAHRYLREDHFNRLRLTYLGALRHTEPLSQWIRGSFGVAELKDHLESKVGGDFDILMVHSSLNGMSPAFKGSALELVRMLIEFVGPSRTLAMPAFFFGTEGRGAHATFVAEPRFDLTRTASQMGLATELFRRMPGVVQSRHPIYRIAALGPHASRLVAGHEHASSPAGRGSPFEFMAACRTRIVGIGKSMEVMTQAHHVEGLMEDEFPVPSRATAPLAMTLVERKQEIPFQLRGREVAGRFDVFRARRLLTKDALVEWKFHGVPMFLADAAEVTRQLVDAARRGKTLYRSD